MATAWFPNPKENDMIKRLKTGLGVVAGLSALALGGSAIASAAGTTPTRATNASAHESSAARDTDNVQQGNQTAPDRTRADRPESTNAETSSESSGETTRNSDGPGGYADEPGTLNADTQQQGQH